jgi:hypothetical protein
LSTPMFNILFVSFPIRSFFETVYFASLKCKRDLRIFFIIMTVIHNTLGIVVVNWYKLRSNNIMLVKFERPPAVWDNPEALLRNPTAMTIDQFMDEDLTVYQFSHYKFEQTVVEIKMHW